MKFLVIVIIVCVCQIFLVHTQIHEAVIKEECGGMKVEQSGLIVHKLTENYTANQFCVWVIKTNNATKMSQIRFKLEDDAFSLYTRLAIYSPTENGDLQSVKSFPRGDRNEYEFTGLAFIVIYQSGPNNQTERGFNLSYSTLNEFSLETETKLTTSFVLSQFNYSDRSVRSHRYPPNGNFYKPNQLFLLVLQPPTLIFPVEKRYPTSLYFSLVINGIEPNCNHDKLSLYHIENISWLPTYSRRWCSGTGTSSWSYNSNIFILTFKSDSKINHLGFTYDHAFLSSYN